MLRLITTLAALVTLVAPALAGDAGYTGKHPGDAKTVRAKDSSGKEWVLNDWREGSRPYAKNLIEREKQYRQKWGEHWAGKTYRLRIETHTMSPGTWKWEEFVVIPDGKKASPSPKKSGYHLWQKAQALVFAPGGCETVTDIYVIVRFGFYYVDPLTKKTIYYGFMPPTKAEPLERKGTCFVFEGQPDVAMRDGLDEKIRMFPTRTRGDNWLTVDPVTGRVYFEQENGKERVLRYVEKLLPYKVGGREMLLPAFLDWNGLHKKVGAEPVVKGGKRAKPRFAVRTTPVRYGMLPGQGSILGRKILLSSDGRKVYVEPKASYPVRYNRIHSIEIDTGKDLGPVADFAGRIPKRYWHIDHSGTCSAYDDWIYQCSHAGSTGDVGRLWRANVKTGRIEMLYDSIATYPGALKSSGKSKDEIRADKSRAKDARKAAGRDDGPADAVSLWLDTTCFQTQSPRTGAIINGGWDAAGLRHYHDGFLTSLAQSAQMGGQGGRPEWGQEPVACFGSLQSNPAIAPNGDVWLTSCQEYRMFKGDKLRLNGIRLIKLSRTDWPAEQPVNGYANRFLKPEDREKLMLEYAKKYIANYAEMSKIYGGR